jgi:hypothetical protein
VPLDFLVHAALWLPAAWALFLAPGQALIPRGATSLSALFVRVVWSAIVTTLVGTTLACASSFSLPAVVAANLLVAAASLPIRRLAFAGERPLETAPAPDRLGPLVFVLALIAWWPGYPSFLGSSDSTAYVSTGVSLAHHGAFWREDELLAEVPLLMRPVLFDSMSQVFDSKGPPFRRVPGAMLLEKLQDTKAWPDFFPVPSVWSALFVTARATGAPQAEVAAPNYAPVFAALALWAFWLLAHRWLGWGYGLAATAMLAASAPWIMSARLPMSEPIAAAFALSALALLAAGGPAMRRGDALLAGAALGAAVFTRIEMALMIAMALALQPSLARPASAESGREVGSWRPTPIFLAAFLGVALLTLIPALSVPGTWTLPMTDHLSNAWIRFLLAFGMPTPGERVVGGGGVVTLLALAVRHFGWSATLRWTFLCAVLAGHAAESRYLGWRTPTWLSVAIGWQGLALAACGAVLAWRSRVRPTAASFALALAAAAVAILFYNPHVYPALPWGARRFVPLLLPLAILLSCHAAARAHARSRLLGVALLALLAWPIAAAGRPLWGRTLLEGAWESLAALDKAIPRDGVVFVDRDISSMMVAPALWLVLDRNNLTVPPTTSAPGQKFLPMLVPYFAAKRPVYFVTRGAGEQSPPANVRLTLLARVPLALPLLEQTYDRRPEKIQRFLMPLAIYRLEPAPGPAPVPAPAPAPARGGRAPR